MGMAGGWFILGVRNDRALALVLGPVQDRNRLVPLLGPAEAAARARYGTEPGDRYVIGWLTLPEKLIAVANEALWLTPEWFDYAD